MLYYNIILLFYSRLPTEMFESKIDKPFKYNTAWKVPLVFSSTNTYLYAFLFWPVSVAIGPIPCELNVRVYTAVVNYVKNVFDNIVLCSSTAANSTIRFSAAVTINIMFYFFLTAEQEMQFREFRKFYKFTITK